MKDDKAEVIEPTELVSEPASGSYVAAIQEEYGQFVATHLLLVGGVPAFAEGSPVNASHPMVPVWLADGSITRVKV